MKKMHLLAGLLSLALACCIVLAQDATPADPPADDKPAVDSPPAAKSGGRAKLTKPWSILTTLSEEQKQEIIALHAKANEDVRAIRDKEEADIMALLTDEQKAELTAMTEKAKAEQKARRAEKKAGAMGGDAGDEPKDK